MQFPKQWEHAERTMTGTESSKRAAPKGRLRHIAMSVPDPWKTAEFYKHAFGFEVVGETDSSLAEGVFLTDGVINLALLNFKSDEAAQGTGRDFVGLHHIGIWVDDPAAARERVEAAGAQWIMGEPDVKGGSFYEIKFTDPNGVIFDISHHGWGGALKDPDSAERAAGQAAGPAASLHDAEGGALSAPARKLLAKFDERREAAAAALAEELGD
jgi:methylmalonyl-CoA/ethylmalonyl-CoA epimerase